jgi:RNA polymerase-binding transcription factor DksA
MLDTKQYEKKLRDRLAELQARLNEVEAELDQPADPDAEESAIERESDEVLEGLGAAGLSEIRKIEAALQRMASGDYGVCVECGEPISEERLNVVPHAARCRNCA